MGMLLVGRLLRKRYFLRSGIVDSESYAHIADQLKDATAKAPTIRCRPASRALASASSVLGDLVVHVDEASKAFFFTKAATTDTATVDDDSADEDTAAMHGSPTPLDDTKRPREDDDTLEPTKTRLFLEPVAYTPTTTACMALNTKGAQDLVERIAQGGELNGTWIQLARAMRRQIEG